MQPLLPGHALAIGVTSYDGGVYFGLTGDRDALPDLDVLGAVHRRGARGARRHHLRRPGSARRAGRKTDRPPRSRCAVTRRASTCPRTLAGCARSCRPTASGRPRSSRTPSPTRCARELPDAGEEELGVRRLVGRRARLGRPARPERAGPSGRARRRRARRPAGGRRGPHRGRGRRRWCRSAGSPPCSRTPPTRRPTVAAARDALAAGTPEAADGCSSAASTTSSAGGPRRRSRLLGIQLDRRPAGLT